MAPVAFASRHTSAAEQKLAATNLEVAGLLFALKHLEVYVLGNQVTVYTDHQVFVSHTSRKMVTVKLIFGEQFCMLAILGLDSPFPL